MNSETDNGLKFQNIFNNSKQNHVNKNNEAQNNKKVSRENISRSSSASSTLYIDEGAAIEMCVPENYRKTSTTNNEFLELENSFEAKFHQKLKILEDPNSKKKTNQNKIDSEVIKNHVISKDKQMANSKY